MEIKTMEGFCRGCLIKYDDPDELLEYTEKNRRLFIYSTGLQVKRNDTFTFQLCKECYLNMKQSCKFKKLCRASDKKFKTYLSLKEAGDAIDLCTYLKNNDDNLTLRFPHWAGNSTPANQRKDDDNESTCTSIGNFMQDILQGTEMRDSEARIIRQVIEEEADVLDESLDSHWLQDDVSIATDFQLDFSFSPFSTPRSINNDHCYTPKRQADQGNGHYGLPKTMSYKPTAPSKVDDSEDDDKPIEIKEYDIFSDSLLDKIVDENTTAIKTENDDEKEIEKIENDLIVEEVDVLSDNQVNQVNSKNYYVDNTLIEQTVNDVVRILEGVEESPTGTSIFNDKNVTETERAVASLFHAEGSRHQKDSGDVFGGKSGKNQMDVDTILSGKSISETQTAVASIYEAQNEKNQTTTRIFKGTKGSETDTAVVSIFDGKTGKRQTEVIVSILDGTNGKDQTKVASKFDGKAGRSLPDLVSLLDGKRYKNQTEITGRFDDKNIREIVSIFDGKTGKQQTEVISTLDGKGGKNQTETTSVFGKAERENQIDIDDDFTGKNGKPQVISSVFDGKGGKIQSAVTSIIGKSIGKQNDDYSIERRLDEALKDDNQEITLEELLRSPTAHPNTAASTPTIHNIIFGDKLDESSNHIKVGQTIEQFDDVQGDINMLDALFDMVEVKDEPKTPLSTPQPDDSIEGASKTLTINVADNLSVNVSYTLPESVQKKPKPKKNKKKPVPDRDYDGVEIVGCVCTICNKKFKDMRVLKMHSVKAHKVKLPRAKKKGEEVKLRICDYCGKEGTDRRNFLRHIKTHMTKQEITCEKCGVIFYTKAKFNKHWKSHLGHNPIQQAGERVCCEICGLSVLRTSISMHRRVHQKQYRGYCEDCGKGYYTLVDYREHKLEHSGERPHACHVCGARFIRRNALVRHIRAHIGEKRFSCDNCNKRYSNKATLIHHIESGRCRDFKETGKMRTRQRPLRAENTIKVFKVMTEEELARKPFECGYCHTRHRSENVLIRHQSINKACKEIQSQAKVPTIIEVLYEKSEPQVQKSEDVTNIKSLESPVRPKSHTSV